ncbi:MAG: polyprenyl synthetase family protein [Firmicutes bacterium]|nr:polyprenyl synthetase family protein [Bacillota bacterium]
MLSEKLKEYSGITDEALKKLFLPDGITPPHMQEVMSYSVMAGGKRLRPALVLAACETLGGDRQRALPFACAIELIHTYSLIHDDMPCIDNDTMRRGRPTSHVMFDEQRALLAGDALLSYAFEIMLDAVVSAGEQDRAAAAAAAKAIADAAGTRAMVAGQWQDVLSEGKQISPQELEYIHIHKTADMIRGAVKAGALIAGAGEEELTCFDEYARRIGLAFQIADDILDVVGDAGKLGKNTGSDAADNKVTYVSLHGLEESRRISRELIQQACRIIKNMDASGFFTELAHFIIERVN